MQALEKILKIIITHAQGFQVCDWLNVNVISPQILAELAYDLPLLR